MMEATNLPNAFRVCITHMQSPSCFWVHKLGELHDQLSTLEADLNKICALYTKSDHLQTPCMGELVAVYHDKMKKWVRGIVIEWKTDGTIFLIDYGYILSKVSQAVRLPENIPALKPQSFQVFLHGVVPLTHSSQDGVTLVKDNKWMLPAASKVLRLMSRCSSFYFECFQKWEDLLMGNLHLVFENQSKPLSLTATLCEADLAVVDTTYFHANFEQQVGDYAICWVSLLGLTSDKQKCQLGYDSPESIQQTLCSKALSEHRISSPKNVYNHHDQTKKCDVVKSNQSSTLDMDLKYQSREQQHSSSGVNLVSPPRAASQSGHNMNKKQATAEAITKYRMHLLTQLTGNFVEYGNAAYNKELDKEVHRTIGGHSEDIEKPNNEVLHQNYDFLQPLTKASYPEAKYTPYCRVAITNKPPENEPLLTTSSTTYSEVDTKFGKTMQDRLAQTAVLVNDNNISRPLRSISEAALHGDIHQALYSYGFRTITNQQKHMWPAILRGQNVISVGGPLTGKMYGYLAPIASNMLDSSLYKDLEQSVGPLVVVLCSNAQKAVTVEKCLQQLTRNERDYNQEQNPRVKILLTYGGCAEVEKVQTLMNGCHVLITTPPCFVRIMNYFQHATDLYRLCHLIFDDADSLFEKHKESVDRILAECKKALNVEWRKKRPMQLIVTCRRWTKHVEDFTKFVCLNPTVFVTCGLEVLAYCKIPPNIHMLPTPNSRTSKAIEIIEQYQNKSRIVVVLNTEEEAMNLGLLLEGKVPNLLLAYDSMDQFNLAGVNEKWLHNEFAAGRQPLLVVTDSVLPELEVINAKVLIHYSMPIMKDVFDSRVACILNNCQGQSAKSQQEAKIPVVHILLDCNDGKQTPALVDLILRMRLPLLEELREKAEEAVRVREEMKSEATLCTNIRNFGFCGREQSCPFRHVVIAKLDANPPNVPKSGEVEFKIIKIHNATHFSARLEKHKSLEGVTTDLMTKEHIFVPMEMKKHFSDPSNSNEKEETSGENLKPVVHIEETTSLKSAINNPVGKMLKRSSETDQNSGTGTMKASSDRHTAAVSNVSTVPKENFPYSDKPTSYTLDNNDAHKKLIRSVQFKNKELILKHNLLLHQVCGDLFSAPSTVSLAHTVAEDFIMTKGIARSFYDKFGGRQKLIAQKKIVGEVAYLQKGNSYIFYLVTKKYTSRTCIPTMHSLKQSLQELKRLCIELNVKHLAMPRIGTGINQLQWLSVKELIETVFFEVEMTISIYQCVIQEVPGSIFSAPYAVSLAHCVAEDLKMTKGVACLFRCKFGRLEELRSQQKKVGEVAFLHDKGKFLFYLVTKEESAFDCKPTLQSMELCLLELRKLCTQYQVTRLAMPKIGSGIDHLTWSDVKDLMELIFKDSNITITVYCLENLDQENY